MTIIGITGPSGAGKGEVSGIIKEQCGFYVIDADAVYHELVSSPSDCVDEIRSYFGDSVINDVGALDRIALRKIVFGKENKDNLSLLNRITHKYIKSEIRKKITEFKKQGYDCIIDAPLLFEAELAGDCNFIISVLADENIRAERISLRDNIDIKEALFRISSQKSDDYYIEKSDYTIYNNGQMEILKSDVFRILSERRVIK